MWDTSKGAGTLCQHQVGLFAAVSGSLDLTPGHGWVLPASLKPVSTQLRTAASRCLGSNSLANLYIIYLLAYRVCM